MMKIKRHLWLTGALLLLAVMGYAQVNYYYYEGEKIYLEYDYETVSFVSDIQEVQSSLSRTLSFTVKNITADNTSNLVTRIQGITNSDIVKEKVIGEIATATIRNEEAYISFIRTLQERPDIIKASPSFKVKDRKIGVSNNFYVKLFDMDDLYTLSDLADQYSIDVVGQNPFMPLWVTLSCGKETQYDAMEAANLFYQSGLFEAAEPELLLNDLLASSDPYFSSQWGLKHTGQSGWSPRVDIKAESAWTITKGSSNIKVAIFDQGYERNHPDLAANNYSTGYDVHNGSAPSVVRGSHGTACAGIVAAVQNNNIGVSGVAPNAKIVDISCTFLTSVSLQLIANGFSWGWRNGMDVISNSWGFMTPSSIVNSAVREALRNGRGGKGTVIVFAAGNENDTNVRYPQRDIPEVIVVGAMSPCAQRKSKTSCDGETNWGSCYGDRLDIMAPGVKIPTTDRQGSAGYGSGDYFLTFNGTSSACPHVAGVAALMLSVNSNLTALDVKNIIEKTGQKVGSYAYTTTAGRENGTWHREMGYGLVDAYAAVNMARSFNCVANQTITTAITASRDYQVSNKITCSSTISSNVTVSFQAKTIELLPGFSFTAGTSGKFQAVINPCNSTTIAGAALAPALDEISYSPESNSQWELGGIESEVRSDVWFDMDAKVIVIDTTTGEFDRAELINLDGKKMADLMQRVNEVNLSTMKYGVYIVKVYMDDVIETHKVVIQ